MWRVVLRSRRTVSLPRCGLQPSAAMSAFSRLELGTAGPGFAESLLLATGAVLLRGMSSGADHTSKWLSNTTMKTPMELIAEVPPIVVTSRIVACEGTKDPALGHPIEYINLDLPHPQVCKYCGLRYVQDHGGHH